MKKTSRVILLVVCMVLLLVFTSACEKKVEQAADAGANAAADSAADDVSADDTADADALEFVFIPKNTGNSYFDSIDRGFAEAAEELGYNYTSVGPTTADATSQLEIVEAQIQRGVDVIAIYLNSSDALSKVLSGAREQGIIVFNVGTDSDDPNDRDAYLGAVDMDAVGPSLIDIVAEMIGGAGEIGVVSGTTDSPDHNYWIEGMKAELASNADYADIKLVEVVYGDDQPEKSLTEAEGLINKHPDLKGIVAPTTVACAATAQAISTMGVAGTVHMTGLGLPNEMRGYIKDGTVTEFALWDPADMGYIAAYLAIDMINNGYVPAVGDTFSCGTRGERTIDENMSISAGAFLIFDETNIDNYDF